VAGQRQRGDPGQADQHTHATIHSTISIPISTAMTSPITATNMAAAGSVGALPDGFAVVAHSYDVESGRMDLDQRGHGTAHEEFDIPVPRDGGIADLLAEAKRPDRRFVAVVCESVDRLAQ
jgi:hypothetical protein